MTAQSNITPESIISDLRYLQLLSRSFPTIADASTEIINLEAILNLPKGTEHFLTDIHGEYEAFQHVLKNASGAVKRKVNEIFGNTLRESEKKEISTLIYYPEEKLQLVKAREKDLDDWYLITLNQLVKVCQNVSLDGCCIRQYELYGKCHPYVHALWKLRYARRRIRHQSSSPGYICHGYLCR